MPTSYEAMLAGYKQFCLKYAKGNQSVMQLLADLGQSPEVMIVSCCDSRVDPALILQCDPGDLFITRNVANIVPPYENDDRHHGTSAALEFGICHLHVKHLIILGHSQCGGINALVNNKPTEHSDFIASWVNVIDVDTQKNQSVDETAKKALLFSYQNCMSFPWISDRVSKGDLTIHLWFFDIKDASILSYSQEDEEFKPLIN